MLEVLIKHNADVVEQYSTIDSVSSQSIGEALSATTLSALGSVVTTSLFGAASTTQSLAEEYTQKAKKFEESLLACKRDCYRHEYCVTRVLQKVMMMLKVYRKYDEKLLKNGTAIWLLNGFMKMLKDVKLLSCKWV